MPTFTLIPVIAVFAVLYLIIAIVLTADASVWLVS